MLVVDCPTCNESVTWNAESAFKPFCSERCKLIDLGEWASEGHVISEQQPDLATVNNTIDLDAIEDLLADNDESFFKE